MVVIDDHLMRDLAADEVPAALTELDEDLASTNLWLFRLCRAITGQLHDVSAADVDRLRREVSERLEVVTIVPMQDLIWPMAELQHRHREAGRGLSAAMAEALASAHFLGAGIAVAEGDVGPSLQGSAEADAVPFYIIGR